jgi:hypothetical protein
MTVLSDKIAQLQTDLTVLHDIVHGDASTTVTTENGSVPSFAKYQADNLGSLISAATTAANTATTKASDAVAAAGVAIGKADEASDSADLAVAKAGEAASSASSALTSKNAAETAASSVGTSVTTATDAAAVATTKAGEASSSAAAALASENNAAGSESNAATSEANALTSKNTAVSAASTATTAAGAASTSATNAGNSESNALTYKNAAASSATAADASKTLADQFANAGVGVEVTPGHFSAYHWSQQVASTLTNGVVYRGPWDASGGVYPAPNAVGTAGDFYKISVAGVISTVDFAVGDNLIYNGTDWDKIDNTEHVTSVAGRSGAITLTKTDVGLPNVDNTSDANKPVSTAQQTALNLKADQSALTTVSNAQSTTASNLSAHVADTANPHGVTATQIGLPNVENKSSNTIRSEITSSNVTAALGFTPVDTAAVNTDGTMGANSDAYIPTQKAVRTYVAAAFASNDAMIFKGGIDASANPNFPAADAGWTYRITVAGKIGGASGVNVEAGDTITCAVDGTLTGTQASVGANWVVTQTNIDGAVTGPASATSGNVALFSGTSGKVVSDSGLQLSGNNTGDETALRIGTLINAATVKTTPDDADNLPITDSTAGHVTRKITWANAKNSIIAAWGALLSVQSNKATPLGADYVGLVDTASSNSYRKLFMSDLLAYVFTAWGGLINTGTGKTTPVDADALVLMDSAASNATKKLTIGNLKSMFMSAVTAMSNKTITASTLDGSPVGASSASTGAFTTLSATGLATLPQSLVTLMRSKVNVVASGATGTIAMDVLTAMKWFYTVAATANFTLNLRGSSGSTLDSVMGVGDSLTVAFLNTNGGSAYYNNVLQIDGTPQTVKWVDGTAPSSGNASAIDVYTYIIIKTATNTYTVIGQRMKCA